MNSLPAESTKEEKGMTVSCQLLSTMRLSRRYLLFSLVCSACIIFTIYWKISAPSRHWKYVAATFMYAKEKHFVPQSEEWSLGHFDASGNFKIVPYVQTAEEWAQLSKDEGAVCLAVQVSLERTTHLVDLVATWRGAISLSLFAPGPYFPLALRYLRYLRRCYPAIKKQVSVHIVYSAGLPPPPNEDVVDEERECDETAPGLVLSALIADDKPSWHNVVEYPQNVMRNVAREHCQTFWVITPDIDMVFSEDAADHLSRFLVSPPARACTLCAFVIPTYEVSQDSLDLPADKSQLLDLVEIGQARQYHVNFFDLNQKLSRLDDWERLEPRKDGEVVIAYPVTEFRFFYEPIYVARRGTPRFDERYAGYGMVRNTQTYEMHLAGYKFHVLDNVFLNHWNFQNPRSALRFNQTLRNKQLFCEIHLPELQARYHVTANPPDLNCW